MTNILKWMPYVKDKTVFKAVMFAIELRKQKDVRLAINHAAKFYNVSQSEVARYMGKFESNKQYGYTWDDANFKEE